MPPRFSIVIPTYNSKRFAPETVASALAQTYPETEVVVDDNASTDGTPQILEDIFGRDPRFKLFKNAEDLNMPNGWNRGIRNATGDYFLLLHSDNLIHPNYVSIVMEYAKRHSSDLLFSDCLYFTGNTPPNLFSVHPSKIKFDLLSGGPRSVAFVFQKERMIPISSVSFSRKSLEGRDPFDPSYAWDPDMDLLVRLVDKTGALILRAPLAAMRTHPEQAPNWRDPSFPVQYRRLLKKQHEFGQTEKFQYLSQCARAAEDICFRLSTIHVPNKIYFKFLGKWVLAELELCLYALTNLARKTKKILCLLPKKKLKNPLSSEPLHST